MSWWAYVTGSVRVSVPGRTQPEIQYILDTVLSHLPRVTGSESDMAVSAIRDSGWNSSSSHDEFGMRTNNLTDEYGYKSRRYGWLRTQNYYTISVNGHLRDREFAQVKAEFMKWLCRLAKRLVVEDVLVRIWDYSSSWVIDDHQDRFYNMWELPSWAADKGDPGDSNWCEYLMWERSPKSDMPLLHVSKYYEDEETDREIARRRQWERGSEI